MVDGAFGVKGGTAYVVGSISSNAETYYHLLVSGGSDAKRVRQRTKTGCVHAFVLAEEMTVART